MFPNGDDSISHFGLDKCDSDYDLTISTVSKSLSSGFNQSNTVLIKNMAMRRRLQRNLCLLGLCFAFGLGLGLGVVTPLVYSREDMDKGADITNSSVLALISNNNMSNVSETVSSLLENDLKMPSPLHLHSESRFPTIDDVKSEEAQEILKNIDTNKYPSVSFVPEDLAFDPSTILDDKVIDIKYSPDRLIIEKEIDSKRRHFEILTDGKNLKSMNEKHDLKDVFKNVFNVESQKDDTMVLKKLDPLDGHIKEFTVQLTQDGMYRKSKEVQLSKPSPFDSLSRVSSNKNHVEFMKPQELAIDVADDSPDTIISSNIYWGSRVEDALPHGYGKSSIETWSSFINDNTAVKLESGCGRMQNRLVTFRNGQQACVRYRQNTDQIQGELFSFYLGQILNLTNLAPSVVSVVDLQSDLWAKISNDIAAAQWNSQRPVVLTKFISNLEAANIPNEFKPLERHLNKYDVGNITMERDSEVNTIFLDKLTGNLRKKVNKMGRDEPDVSKFDKNGNLVAKVSENVLNKLVELAQWSDLIIFDYLTANLDRIVNNLYNYQWNVNIMDAPAHNLARKIDNNLLVFLDNESGLLHGYRLLKKYEVYHTLLLDNLCVFRKSTATILKQLKENGRVGVILNSMFDQYNSKQVKDVLPNLPEKSIKILNERIDRVYSQIKKCESLFMSR